MQVDERESLSRRRFYYAGLLALLFFLAQLNCTRPVHAQAALPLWYEVDSQGEVQIHFYFFWSESCPHCQAAHPFIDALPTAYPWLQLHDAELSSDPAHVEQYVALASALGQEAQYVPAFFYCGVMLTGYDSAETTGEQIRANLERCYGQVQGYVQVQNATATAATSAQSEVGAVAKVVDSHVPAEQAIAPTAMPLGETSESTTASTTVVLPLVGAVALAQLSLPLMTVVLAGLDGFNPCAFFVLMFLLSLMVHAGSRARMFLIGALFVLCSGVVYFLFMAAWLNLFLVLGALRWITIVAGLLAILLALINIKDFFWFKAGISLSIPDHAKPKLYERARGLLQAERLAPLLLGTVLLALAANSYELLCTTGFPLIYTRMLTLAALPTVSYYLYLALYNLIYIVPLLLIVIVFVVKFGSRKLSEREGRALKLLSGLMMLMLGILLVIAPDLLGQIRIAVALLAAALLITTVIVFLDQSRAPHKH